jgi:hypothetical protein
VLNVCTRAIMKIIAAPISAIPVEVSGMPSTLVTNL